MLLDHPPAMPGFRVSRVADGPSGKSVEQKPEHGEAFAMPAGHLVKGVSALVDPDGREIVKWIKTREDAAAQAEAMRAAVEAFKSEIPHALPTVAPKHVNADLLNQYTITDLHLNAHAWGKQTGADWGLKIGERLIMDWFAAAIDLAPPAERAVFAELGDWLHFDAQQAITPEHGNLLDADSRQQKAIQVAIRVLRWIVRRLLAKHAQVHIIFADANHDPVAGAWLREMFAAFYDREPRITVDTSPKTYYCVEHGLTSLFYHHGHRRGPAKGVDTVFAGEFREVFGRTKFSYAHTGHKHADELRSTNLMKVEQHETLAGRDAYAANGGWITGRSAKVITYSRRFGEVSRLILSPEMVAGASVGLASKDVDNSPGE